MILSCYVVSQKESTCEVFCLMVDVPCDGSEVIILVK